MTTPRHLPRRPDGRPADFGPGLVDGDVGPPYQGREGGEGEDTDVTAEGDLPVRESQRPT